MVKLTTVSSNTIFLTYKTHFCILNAQKLVTIFSINHVGLLDYAGARTEISTAWPAASHFNQPGREIPIDGGTRDGSIH